MDRPDNVNNNSQTILKTTILNSMGGILFLFRGTGPNKVGHTDKPLPLIVYTATHAYLLLQGLSQAQNSAFICGLVLSDEISSYLLE